MWRSWMREPLVHFLVLGSLLFAVFAWAGGGRGAGSRRIVITSGQVDALAGGFARTWQRMPSDEELKAQIDEYVREEIATREAMAMGLDRDDTVIRRRLRQKFEFLAEDTLDVAPPGDAELQAWLDAHPDGFRTNPQVAFRQVFLSPDKRGAATEGDALRLLEQISRDGPDAELDGPGDALMLPDDVALSTRQEIARLFGAGFADAVLEVEPGRWTGPLRSGYGLHLVFVRERVDGRLPALAEVRPDVEREFTVDRRRRQLDAVYQALLDRYQVVVERRASGDRP